MLMTEILVALAYTFQPFKGKQSRWSDWSVTSLNFQASAHTSYTSTAHMFLDILSAPFNNESDIFYLWHDFIKHVIQKGFRSALNSFYQRISSLTKRLKSHKHLGVNTFHLPLVALEESCKALFVRCVRLQNLSTQVMHLFTILVSFKKSVIPMASLLLCIL